MYDKVELGANGPFLLARHIKLDTRMLGIGFHIPF
jgi:methanesulfonate monooxygenase small subunit